jgi:hypothetical protein
MSDVVGHDRYPSAFGAQVAFKDLNGNTFALSSK